VKLRNCSDFYGVIYAPGSAIDISGKATHAGAFVGNRVAVRDKATVLYDTALRSSP
jgi:hypothetical protein